jgi:hypothetical protein
MKKTIVTLTLLVLSSSITISVIAACGSYFQSYSADTFDGSCPTSTPYKTAHWRLFFTDAVELNDVQVTEPGICIEYPPTGVTCYPGYETPYWKNKDKGIWNQKTTTPTYAGGGTCDYSTSPKKDHVVSYYCNSEIEECELQSGHFWNFSLIITGMFHPDSI